MFHGSFHVSFHRPSLLLSAGLRSVDEVLHQVDLGRPGVALGNVCEKKNVMLNLSKENQMFLAYSILF